MMPYIGYCLADSNTAKITISRNVRFLRNVEISEPVDNGQLNDAVEILIPMGLEDKANSGDESDHMEAEQSQGSVSDGDDTDDQFGSAEDDTLQNELMWDDSFDDVRRSQRTNFGKPPQRFSFSMPCIGVQEEPKTYNQAVSGPNGKNWLQAMETEMQAIRENNTWELVDLPHDSKPIYSKWVFKLKRDSEGKVNTFKARLVARGFSQVQGVDYGETYAPVVRHTTLRLLLSVAAKRNHVTL